MPLVNPEGDKVIQVVAPYVTGNVSSEMVQVFAAELDLGSGFRQRKNLEPRIQILRGSLFRKLQGLLCFLLK